MIDFFRNLKIRINKSEFFKNVVTLTSGRIISQAIGLITVPIISRIYSQEAFGEFNIIISTGTIILGFGTIGLTSAIMEPREDEEAQKIFFTAFISQNIIYFMFFIVSLIILPYFKIFNTSISNYISFLLLYIYLIFSGLFALLETYLNRIRRYKVLFWNSLIGSASTLLITIPMGLLNFGMLGFITASITSLVIADIIMLKKENPFKEILRPGEIIKIYRRYKKFLIYQFPANLISSFTVQLPKQILSRNFGNKELGSYSMSERVLKVPISFIGTPINIVYFKTASQYFKEGKDLGKFTFSLIKRILLFAFLPLVLIMAFGDKIFAFVLGDNWEKAGLIASFLILSYVLLFCNLCVSYCRVVLQKQKINTIMSFINLFVVVISIIIGIFVFKDLMSTIISYAIGITLFYITDLAVNFYYMKSKFLEYLFFIITYIIVSCSIALILKIIF
jgi:O-antigen/teichoic acid export membrane protein